MWELRRRTARGFCIATSSLQTMIDGPGRVRITDFGLAVAAEEDVSGTPPYMALEHFAGKGGSVRSDIYALGLVFYEVFTDRRAFEAKPGLCPS